MFRHRRKFGTLAPRPVYVPPVLPAATTWSATDKHSAIYFEPGTGNLQFGGYGAESASVRSAAAVGATQKVYLEMSVVALDFRIFIGFANSSSPLTGTPGDDSYYSNGWSFDQYGQTHMAAGNGAYITDGYFGVGNTVDLAMDFGSMKLWARTNNGAWNSYLTGGGSTPQNPATGEGGWAVNLVYPGPYYAIGTCWNAVGRMRFAQSDWQHTDLVPFGFTQIAA